eukprot:scaffold28362_cov65-Phaeocystis_antarctica.AAC.2
MGIEGPAAALRVPCVVVAADAGVQRVARHHDVPGGRGCAVRLPAQQVRDRGMRLEHPGRRQGVECREGHRPHLWPLRPPGWVGQRLGRLVRHEAPLRPHLAYAALATRVLVQRVERLCHAAAEEEEHDLLDKGRAALGEGGDDDVAGARCPQRATREVHTSAARLAVRTEGGAPPRDRDALSRRQQRPSELQGQRQAASLPRAASVWCRCTLSRHAPPTPRAAPTPACLPPRVLRPPPARVASALPPTWLYELLGTAGRHGSSSGTCERKRARGRGGASVGAGRAFLDHEGHVVEEEGCGQQAQPSHVLHNGIGLEAVAIALVAHHDGGVPWHLLGQPLRWDEVECGEDAEQLGVDLACRRILRAMHIEVQAHDAAVPSDRLQQRERWGLLLGGKGVQCRLEPRELRRLQVEVVDQGNVRIGAALA